MVLKASYALVVIGVIGAAAEVEGCYLVNGTIRATLGLWEHVFERGAKLVSVALVGTSCPVVMNDESSKEVYVIVAVFHCGSFLTSSLLGAYAQLHISR